MIEEKKDVETTPEATPESAPAEETPATGEPTPEAPATE